MADNDERDDFQKKVDSTSDDLFDFITTPKGIALIGLFLLGGVVGLVLAFFPA